MSLQCCTTRGTVDGQQPYPYTANMTHHAVISIESENLPGTFASISMCAVNFGINSTKLMHCAAPERKNEKTKCIYLFVNILIVHVRNKSFVPFVIKNKGIKSVASNAHSTTHNTMHVACNARTNTRWFYYIKIHGVAIAASLAASLSSERVEAE